MLCSLSKIFDKIIYKHLYFNIINKLSTNQHGFIAARSTNTNLFNFCNHLYNSVVNRGQTDTIFFDLQKAFDTVNHDILLLKLQLFGLNEAYLQWFRYYLSNRSFQVKIDNVKSKEKSISMGVPQGGNLSPLLFNCFINDITSLCSSVGECGGLLFADDLKIFKSINSFHDCLVLQNVINNISIWCKANHININLTKSVFMQFTRKRNIIDYEYNLNNSLLKKETVVKDLGVYFDAKLHFHAHINY